MSTLAARISTATYTLKQGLLRERGDGPADNAGLMAAGVAAATALGAAVLAAVSAKAGSF